MAEDHKGHQRFPDTRWSLVGRAGADDAVGRRMALGELLHQYLPGLRAFLVQTRRIPADLADDLLNDFVANKILIADIVSRADRDRGKFRNFVLKSLNNYISDKLKREYARQAASAGLGDDFIQTIRSEPKADEFDKLWVSQVVHDTMQIMERDCRARGRDDLWRIFELRIVAPFIHDRDPAPYDEIVSEMGLESPRQAINLLATSKRSFLRHLETAVSRYAMDDSAVAEELADLRAIIAR